MLLLGKLTPQNRILNASPNLIRTSLIGITLLYMICDLNFMGISNTFAEDITGQSLPNEKNNFFEANTKTNQGEDIGGNAYLIDHYNKNKDQDFFIGTNAKNDKTKLKKKGKFNPSQGLAGGKKNQDYYKDFLEKKKSSGPLKSPKYPSEDAKIFQKDPFLSENNSSQKIGENEQFLQYEDDKFIRNNYYKGQWALAIKYLKDDYDYQNDKGFAFEKVFRSPSSRNYGQLHVQFQKYLKKGTFEPYIHVLGGLGFSQGNSIFASGDLSEGQKVSLWVMPVDLGLGLEFGFAPYVKVGVMGGASILGLTQNRSDLEDGESKKRRTQFAYGPVFQGHLKFSLSYLDSGLSISQYSSYDITQSYATLGVRRQDYKKGLEGITVSGTSFFIGFDFEYQ